MFDLIIKGGTIVDGTGRARFVGDVAVDDGRIGIRYSIRRRAMA